jgi:hypothetical protein
MMKPKFGFAKVMMGRFAAFVGVVMASVLFAQGQDAKRFEGYSFEINADSSSACPVRFLPQEGGRNRVQVFLAGTNRQSPATGLTACDGSSVQGNVVSPNGLQKWCFQGPEELYEIRLSNNENYLWPALGRDTGFYNVMDFRPVRRVAGQTTRYEPSTPADYTATIKNAIAYIASRQGGTLRFPDGDYIVGTTDGNARDPNFQAITLPSGTTIEGASSNISTTLSQLPQRQSAARIRLRNDKQSIFRIGGCTNQVTIRNIELLGNVPLLGEGRRSRERTYGVEAMGKWAIDPATKAEQYNSSQFFRFENVVFQDFDTGLRAHNTNAENCNPANQRCGEWQFDYIKVDHGVFLNNNTGIYIDSFNTDWKITNSTFSYLAALTPGTGIHVKHGGTVLVEHSFGGGYDYASSIGGTFLYIDTIGSLTVVASAAERGQRSIYTSPGGSISSMVMTVIGSTFGDKVELNGRLNFVSSGNFYGAATVQAQPQVSITSLGDRFCYDPLVFAGHCKDERGATERNPGFNGGTIMFRTGSPAEGTGANLINQQPNYFGSDVQIANGALRLDPNMTFRDITALAAGGEGKPAAPDGTILYCKDCRKSSSGACAQGTAGTDGAFAKRINGQWRCD